MLFKTKEYFDVVQRKQKNKKKTKTMNPPKKQEEEKKTREIETYMRERERDRERETEKGGTPKRLRRNKGKHSKVNNKMPLQGGKLVKKKQNKQK